MIAPDWLRRARLQGLMARHLVNWRDVWRAYRAAARLPPLQFRNGITLVHGPRDSAGFLFFEVFANGCYRVGLPKTLHGTVIDIGANIGAFTIDCAARYPDVRIHAYEPDPDTCATLRRNVTSNGFDDRVTIWNEAVMAREGALTLWRGDGSLATGAFLRAERRGECCAVSSVPLRTVVERAGRHIALLKIDAEGAEAEILEAAPADLDAVDLIVGEYHESLVPDVRARIEKALTPAFEMRFSCSGRCGPMLRARRVARAGSERTS